MTVTPRRIARNKEETQRSVHHCNFRSKGRLSNQYARALTSTHEGLARQLGTMLDAFLGTELELKLAAVEQTSMSEHIAELAPLTYVAPFTYTEVPSTMIVECDLDIVFPMVDLLLGGTGDPANEVRELSEIEEEIVSDLVTLIVRQAESAWHVPTNSLSPAKRIKTSMIYQLAPLHDKVTCVRFEINVSGVRGALRLVFPASFLNVLTQQIEFDLPRERGTVRYFPGAPLRERILDCEIELAVELTALKASVRDVVALQPGSIVRLRAPVKTPGMLTASGLGVFEAVPVRNGGRKAAQLGRRISPAEWERMQDQWNQK